MSLVPFDSTVDTATVVLSDESRRFGDVDPFFGAILLLPVSDDIGDTVLLPCLDSAGVDPHYIFVWTHGKHGSEVGKLILCRVTCSLADPHVIADRAALSPLWFAIKPLCLLKPILDIILPYYDRTFVYEVPCRLITSEDVLRLRMDVWIVKISGYIIFSGEHAIGIRRTWRTANMQE